MTNNNKVVAIVAGAVAAMFALSVIVRFVLLSQYGGTGSWMYLGLPFGGIGLVLMLLRLGLLNSGQAARGISPFSQPGPQQYSQPGYQQYSQPGYQQFPQPGQPPVSLRLQELDYLRMNGQISEAEYYARRQHTLAGS